MIPFVTRSFAAVGLCLAMAGGAAAQTYECTADGRGNQGNLIPPQWVISYNGAAARISHAWFDGPRTVDVSVRGGATKRMNFVIPNFAGFGGRTADLVFNISHNTGNGSLNVRVNPRGYDNRFTGRGTCRPAQ